MNADDDEPEIPTLNENPNESDDSFYSEASEEVPAPPVVDSVPDRARRMIRLPSSNSDVGATELLSNLATN